jgi:Raf kinase inhibitor-like YbhB/YbcL family protein
MAARSRERYGLSMRLTSTAFEHGGVIPRDHTCEGSDRSPPLVIHDVPKEAKSLALIVDDPDAPDPKAPKRTWVHWVLFNLPPNARNLSDGGDDFPGALEGRNDWNKTAYGGPCPPVGRHRYFFKLYALDVVLTDLQAPTKAALESAMQGHIVAQAELMGTYQKSK